MELGSAIGVISGVGVIGSLAAVFLLWRWQVTKTDLAKERAARAKVDRELGTEREVTAELRAQLAAKDNVIAVLKRDLEKTEGDLDALSTKNSGATRERARDLLRKQAGPGKTDPGAA